MMVGDPFFKINAKKLITFKFGDCATVVNFVVVAKKVMKKVGDVRVIPREKCFCNTGCSSRI